MSNETRPDGRVRSEGHRDESSRDETSPVEASRVEAIRDEATRADERSGPRIQLVVSDLGNAPGGEERSSQAPTRKRTNRLDLDPEKTKDGVAQLVLTLIKFLHELLDRQAVRRMEAGTLTQEEIERLGVALMKQAEQLERLRKEFGLEEKDLNLDLGPLGKLV